MPPFPCCYKEVVVVMAVVVMDAIVVVVLLESLWSVDELAVTDMTLLLFIVDGDGSCDRQSSSAHISVD